jgi:hypothetical protein
MAEKTMLRRIWGWIGDLHTGLWIWESFGGAGMIAGTLAIFLKARHGLDWLIIAAIFVASSAIIYLALRLAGRDAERMRIKLDHVGRRIKLMDIERGIDRERSSLEFDAFVKLRAEFNSLSHAQKMALWLVCKNGDGVHELTLMMHMETMGFGNRDDVRERITRWLYDCKFVEITKKGMICPHPARLRDIEDIVLAWDPHE